ncbi:MAG: mechanosensitive ion channel [Akkermansiaceae bacterium]|nr:mechanosensitive ion channel [Akkermansiaceae bacterium]
MKPVFLFIFLFVLGVFADLRAADPAPQTTSDPGIPTAELVLRLDPLTVDEIKVEVLAWQEILKANATEIAMAEIATRKEDHPDYQAKLEALPALRERKKSLLRRFDAVLTAYELKGGDASSFRKYAAAVDGIKPQTQNVTDQVHEAGRWITSEEGGKRWAILSGKFIGILLAAWILSSIIAKIVARAIERGPRLSGLLKRFINLTIRRIVLVVGLIVALGTIGVNVGAALALIGGGAFIIGFALQETLGNLASGLMLLIHRPFDVGDAVEIGGVSGTVDNVSLANTTIRTFDNKLVLVPNKSVWGQTITNITGLPTRRVDLVFGIDYKDDIEKAMNILRRIVSAHPLILKEPEAVIEVNELGDFSVNLICRPWTKTADYWRVHWDLTRQVKEAFDNENITIPFPQSEIHLVPPTAP